MQSSPPAWYPLLLSAPVRAYAFGERLIPGLLGKTGLPDGKIAETWEYSAYPGSESTILNGQHAGVDLQQLAARWPAELVSPGQRAELFPLLGKFLDASHRLPVHLHADDATAREVHGAPNGKTEAWHIIHAQPGTTVLAGVKPEATEAELREAFLAQDYDRVMRRLSVSPGDTLYIPGGVLHSFGPGTVVFEVQQTSDLTQSVEPDDVYGTPLSRDRQEANISATLAELRRDWLPEVSPGLRLQAGGAARTFCTASPHFVMERWRLSGPFTWARPRSGFTALTNLGAPVTVTAGSGSVRLERATSCIVPAAAGPARLEPAGAGADLIACYVPDLQAEVLAPLRAAGFSDADIGTLGEPFA